MSDKFSIEAQTLVNISNAIREEDPTPTSYTPRQMPDAIRRVMRGTYLPKSDPVMTDNTLEITNEHYSPGSASALFGISNTLVTDYGSYIIGNHNSVDKVDYAVTMGYNNKVLGSYSYGSIYTGTANTVECGEDGDQTRRHEYGALYYGDTNHIINQFGNPGCLIGGKENKFNTHIHYGSFLTGWKNTVNDNENSTSFGDIMYGMTNSITTGSNEGAMIGGYDNTVNSGAVYGGLIAGTNSIINAGSIYGSIIVGHFNQLHKAGSGDIDGSIINGANNTIASESIRYSDISGYKNTITTGQPIYCSRLGGNFNQITGSGGQGLYGSDIYGSSNIFGISPYINQDTGEVKKVAINGAFVRGCGNTISGTAPSSENVEGLVVLGAKNLLSNQEIGNGTIIGSNHQITSSAFKYGSLVAGRSNIIRSGMSSAEVFGYNNSVDTMGGNLNEGTRIEGMSNKIHLIDSIQGAHYEGVSNNITISAGGYGTHIEGYYNDIVGKTWYGCHLEGGNMIIRATGDNNQGFAYGCHFEGQSNIVQLTSGTYGLHVEGGYNKVYNTAYWGSHVEGYNNTVSHMSYGTHIEGESNLATYVDGSSHIEGYCNTLNAHISYCHIEGDHNLINHIYPADVPELANRIAIESSSIGGWNNKINFHSLEEPTGPIQGVNIHGSNNALNYKTGRVSWGSTFSGYNNTVTIDTCDDGSVFSGANNDITFSNYEGNPKQEADRDNNTISVLGSRLTFKNLLPRGSQLLGYSNTIQGTGKQGDSSMANDDGSIFAGAFNNIVNKYGYGNIYLGEGNTVIAASDETIGSIFAGYGNSVNIGGPTNQCMNFGLLLTGQANKYNHGGIGTQIGNSILGYSNSIGGSAANYGLNILGYSNSVSSIDSGIQGLMVNGYRHSIALRYGYGSMISGRDNQIEDTRIDGSNILGSNITIHKGSDDETIIEYSNIEGRAHEIFNSNGSGMYGTHVEGFKHMITTGTSDGTHIEGREHQINLYVSDGTHVSGLGHIVPATSNEHAYDTTFFGGRYSIPKEDQAVIIGNGHRGTGSAAPTRSNAYTLDWEGNAEYSGEVLAKTFKYTDEDGVVQDLLTIIKDLQDRLAALEQ